MTYKIDNAIIKLDKESGKYDLVDPEGKFKDKDVLIAVNSDDLITMQLLVNAISRNDFKVWEYIKPTEDKESFKGLLVKLGYGREDIARMLKEF